MSHEYFFELLAEEIPSWMLESRLAMLREQLEELARLSLDCGDAEIEVDATSRRIAFRMAGLAEVTREREEEVKGPPRRMAFDGAGAPTKALEGFLRKNGVGIDSVLDDGTDYVRIRRVIPGRGAEQILAAGIPRIIEGLRWPKMMRWGLGEHAWIRPVHSVISLFHGRPLPITIFGVESGVSTTGHRTLGRETFEVSSWRDYVDRLAKAHVVVRAGDRIATMRQRARDLADEVGGEPADDSTIWAQWRYLTEAPGLIRAEFDPEFLSLPEEVLVTVMRVHQKQLPILANGKLTSSFLAVVDQIGDPDGNAASGNAFVTNARFADARFFYETDRKKKLDDRMGDLAHLQFHEKLGNYADKSRRIEQIARGICELTGRDPRKIAKSARLAKADLVTEMVKEFTELQGRVGGIYAREEGLPEIVWQAIWDHYLPVNAEDPLPRGEAGAIVSLADRIDTLAGFLSMGMRPTGSKDPFALRRAAQGVVQIQLARTVWEIAIDLDRLIALGLDAYGETPRRAETVTELTNFIAERVRNLLENAPFGFAYDEINAAMASGWTSSLTDLLDRADALRSVRGEPGFLSILDSAKRIANITQDHPSSVVDASLLNEPPEKRLADLALLVGEQIDKLLEVRDYKGALSSFAGLAAELESFFNEVMVMVDDPAIRSNRKALLRRVGGLVSRIADVALIVVDRREYASVP